MGSSNDALQGSDLTITTSGVSWTSQALSVTHPSWGYGSRIWTAVGDGNSWTVAADAGAFSVHDYRVDVYEYRSDNGGTVGIGATAVGSDADGDGAASITLSGTPAATSIILAACQSAVGSGAPTIDVGSGWTELMDAAVSGWGVWQMQYRTSYTGTSVDWADIIVGGGPNGGAEMLALEVTHTDAGATVNTKTISEAVDITEALVRSALRNVHIVDTVTITEEPIFREILFNLYESITITDSLSRFPVRSRVTTDTVAINELLTRTMYANRLITDLVTITESIARTAYHNRTVDDLLTIYENITAQYIPSGGGGSTVYSKTIAEAVSLTEFVLAQAFRNALIADSLSISESITSMAMRNRMQTDIVTISEAQIRYAVRSPVAFDTVDITDTSIRRVWYTRLIDEAVNVVQALIGAYVPNGASLFEVRSVIGIDNSAQAVVGSNADGMPMIGGY